MPWKIITFIVTAIALTATTTAIIYILRLRKASKELLKQINRIFGSDA